MEKRAEAVDIISQYNLIILYSKSSHLPLRLQASLSNIIKSYDCEHVLRLQATDGFNIVLIGFYNGFSNKARSFYLFVKTNSLTEKFL